jgi:hypothetical protein
MLTQLTLQHTTVYNHTPVLPTPYTHDVFFNLQSPNLTLIQHLAAILVLRADLLWVNNTQIQKAFKNSKCRKEIPPLRHFPISVAHMKWQQM